MRHKQSTKRQREAVKYTEAWLQIKFNGNINNFYECSAFLEEYLDEAKMREDELTEEYKAYMWERMMS